MSEDNQENGAANGDVPEIELIIKDETNFFQSELQEATMPITPLQLPALPIESAQNEYVLFELKCDNPPSYSYVITHAKEPPPDISNPINEKEPTTCMEPSVTEIIANPEPYVISVDIPVTCYQKKSSCTENSHKTRRSLAYQKNVAAAVDDVVNKGMSINKAAKNHEVTKSYLWKEVNKQTNSRMKKVDKNLNKQIDDRICAGESLSGIARTLKMSKSTIHMHKVRLAQKGKLPPNITFKPPTNKADQLVMKERIIQAFRGIRVNGMSIRFAAKFFSVPPSTLSKHIRRFRATQKKQAAYIESTSEEDTSDEDKVLPKEKSEDVPAVNAIKTTKGVDADDFKILNAYCDQQTEGPNNEEFLISFDYDTFEEYVKREVE